MKKIYFSTMIACLLAFVGCQNEELVNETTDTGKGKKVTLTAHIQGSADSRVALTPETSNGATTVKVDWRNDSNNPEKFKVHGTGSEPVWTEFTQTQGNNFAGTLPEGADYAYYGYTVSDNTLSYDLSSQDGTLNEDCILMQADMSQNSSKITFHHQTAILKPTFKVGDAYIYINNITKIVMRGVHAGSGKNSITVLRTSVPDEEKNNIYIFLPIGTDHYSGDTFKFTVTIADGEEYAATLTIPEDKSIEAGMLYTAELSLDIPYVTFRAASEQTLDLVQTESPMLDASGNFVYADDEETIYVYVPNPYPGSGDDDGSIQYSVGNSNVWTTFTPESQPVLFGGDNGDLRLRGKSPNGTLWAQIVFGDRYINVACSGDIRTLVDWEKHETADTSYAIFRGLFKDCSVLTSAPELPATTLAPYCYKSMFYGCTSTSLTKAPVLPATSLAESCYGQMFQGCTNLAAAPELSATDLANDCYNGMFVSCTNLTSAPELPATTLKPGCYNGMFNDCESLTSAPELPATTLVDYCYNQMFSGCTSLNSVTMLATNISAPNCLTFWMDGVPAGDGEHTRTFTKHKDMESLPNGVNGIPSGWTVKNYGE